jgi:hypothetical protein
VSRDDSWSAWEAGLGIRGKQAGLPATSNFAF